MKHTGVLPKGGGYCSGVLSLQLTVRSDCQQARLFVFVVRFACFVPLDAGLGTGRGDDSLPLLQHTHTHTCTDTHKNLQPNIL